MSTILEKIKSVKLCLMAHPDNEQYSEFEDRISDLEEIENELSKDNWIKIEKEEDIPKDSSAYWIWRSDERVSSLNDYETDKSYFFPALKATHYQPIIKPNKPTT